MDLITRELLVLGRFERFFLRCTVVNVERVRSPWAVCNHLRHNTTQCTNKKKKYSDIDNMCNEDSPRYLRAFSIVVESNLSTKHHQ